MLLTECVPSWLLDYSVETTEDRIDVCIIVMVPYIQVWHSIRIAMLISSFDQCGYVFQDRLVYGRGTLSFTNQVAYRAIVCLNVLL